jgi:hypothetical protein
VSAEAAVARLLSACDTADENAPAEDAYASLTTFEIRRLIGADAQAPYDPEPTRRLPLLMSDRKGRSVDPDLAEEGWREIRPNELENPEVH